MRFSSWWEESDPCLSTHQNTLSPLLQPGPPLLLCCCVPINLFVRSGGSVLRNHKFLQLYSLLIFLPLNSSTLRVQSCSSWVCGERSLALFSGRGLQLRCLKAYLLKCNLPLQCINQLSKTIFSLTLIGNINVMQVWPNGKNIKSYGFSKSLRTLALLLKSYSCLWLHSNFSDSCNIGCILNSYHKSMKKNIYRACGR